MMKNKMMKGYLLALVAGLLVSCQQMSQDSTATSGTDPESMLKIVEGMGELGNELQELSRPNKVQAWVDDLIVKAQPGSDMPEVARMQEGEVAEYLYQRTTRKSEIVLRDQRFLEPWILIRTQDGFLGWVHEGGVRYLQPDYFSLLSGEPQSEGTQTRGVESKPAVSPKDFLIVPGSRVGPITLATSEEDLIRIYGTDAVTRGDVQKSASEAVPCTIVMNGTENEVRVTWKDEERTKVEAVYLLKPHSQWMTGNGLHTGMALSELTKTNKNPVSFHGFGWDFAGVVNSWWEGIFKAKENSFYVALSPAPTASRELLKNFKGETVFTSNTEQVQELGLFVDRIVVYLD